MSRFIQYLITEDKETDLIETCQMVGVVCSDDLYNRMKKFLDNPKGYDKKSIEKLLEDYKAIAGAGGYDWNARGVKQIDNIKASNRKSGKMIDAFNLAIGMKMFVNKIGDKYLGTKTPSFIHGRITDYYKAEKKWFGEVPGSKDNTSDCILSSLDASTTLAQCNENKPTGDKDENYVTAGKAVMIQCSLKKSKKGAQLGKAMGYIKDLYSDEDDKGVKKGRIPSNKDAAGELSKPPSLEDTLAMMNQSIEVRVNNQTILYEGLWDKVKAVASGAWKKVKGVLGKFSSKWLKVFKKGVNKKHLNDFLKPFGLKEGQIDGFAYLLVEASRAKKGDPPKGIEDFETAPQELINAVWANKPTAIKIFKDSVKDLQKMANKSKGVTYDIKVNTNLDIQIPDDVFKLVSNYLTVRMIQEMVKESDSLSQNVSKIMGETFFGATKLPLWKVYGWYGESTPWGRLGTLETYVKNRPKSLDVETLGFRIKPKDRYHTITMFLLSGMDDKSMRKYGNFRTGTNSSSSLTFNLEGVKEIGPFPMETTLKDIMGSTPD